MDLCWCPEGTAFDTLAADRVSALVAARPRATFALPTGRTPRGLYAELARRAAADRISLRDARWFNLDEYGGLAATDPASFAACLQREFVVPAGIPQSQVRFLRGDAPDLAAECRDYDAALAAAGGLDVAILGLGANGHIAFNEPGSAWDTHTRVVRLSPQTRMAGAADGAPALPEFGLTMGIATLRAARAVLLLVTGQSKRAALAALRAGTPSRAWPATSLLDHPRLTVICAAELRDPA